MSEVEEKKTTAEEFQRELLLAADMLKALKHFNDAPRTCGRILGYAQERALRIIADKDGILQRDLQDIMDSRPSAMSLLLSKLEEAGFIDKALDPSDNRKVSLWITEEGTKYLDEHDAPDDEVDPSLCLNEEEREYYLAFTERIIEYLETEMKARGMKPIGPGIANAGKRRELPPLGGRDAWNEKYLRGPEKEHLPFDIEKYGNEDEGPFWLEHPEWPNAWAKDSGENPPYC